MAEVGGGGRGWPLKTQHKCIPQTNPILSLLRKGVGSQVPGGRELKFRKGHNSGSKASPDIIPRPFDVE